MDRKPKTVIIWCGLVVLIVVAMARAQAPTPRAQPAAPGPAPAAQGAGRGSGPQTGTARIRGRVVTGDTGTPIGHAQVRLTSTTLVDPRTVATDEQGRYEIAELPAGSFTLTAAKSGYLTLSFGQRRPLDAGRPVALAAAQSFDAIDFRLPKGSVITVQVADEFGEPLPGAEVQVQQYRFVAAQGERALAPAGSAGGVGPAETNDLGEVRVYGLAPGEYYVTALMRSRVVLGAGDRPLSYAPTYYPGTASFDTARRVTVGVGQEASVSLAMLTGRTSSIRGVIRRSDGTVNPVPRASLSRFGSSTVIPVQPDGSFAMSNLWPGDYRIIVGVGAAPAATDEFVSVPIKVTGEDITGLVITTTKGGIARGQVVFDTGAPGGSPPTLGTLTLAAPPGTPGAPRTTWKENWTFEINSISGPRVMRYTMAPGTADPWVLKAVMLDGKDIIDTPIDFTGKEVNDLQLILTQKRTEVSGTVVDAQGSPVADYAAVLFAEDPQQRTGQTRFIAAGRPSPQGRFMVAGLPPGRYLAAAVDALENGEEHDLELLKKLETGAQRLTLGEGETKSLNLKLVQ